MALRGRCPRVVRRCPSDNGDSGPESKRPRSETPVTSADRPSDVTQPPGAISRLEVSNFMCHEHLMFDFNANVNFITGQNGSGKSAVLTAVMVGLGGRASATGRGSAITELIRTGEPSAVISVTLCNAGVESHQPDVFGETITVERTIRASGASAYRLLNANNKVVSTKKKDLVLMMDALNIQVDNPIAILNQDTSKNFLRVDDPTKKYKLFLTATRLSQTQRWQDETNRKLRSSRNVLADKKQSVEALKSEMDKYERQVNLRKHYRQIQQKVELLEHHLLWAKVKEKENMLEEAVAKHSVKKKSVERYTRKHTELTDKVTRMNDEKTNIERQRDQLGQQMADRQRVTDQLRSALRDSQTCQQEAASRLRTTQTDIQHKQCERDNMQQEIEHLRRPTEPDEAAQSERRRVVARLESELQRLDATERSQQAHLQHVDGTVSRLRDELRRNEVEQRHRQRRIDELDEQLQGHRATQAHPHSVFGGWVAAVKRDIDAHYQQHRFRKKPIGPVGAYIRVRAGCEHWMPLVETGLDRVLTAYLVDDQIDLTLMASILKRHAGNEYNKPRVIASRFLTQVHDTRRHGIDVLAGQHVSLWSVLDIQHPVVANAVIDQLQPESVLLLRTDAEARDLAFRDRVPAGCKEALTLTGYRYYPDPGYRTYPVTVPRQSRYLQVSVEEVIRQLTEQQGEQREQAEGATHRVTEARQALQDAQQQQCRASSRLQTLRGQKQAVERQLRQLNIQEEPETYNLQALEEEVNSLTRTIEQLKAAEAPLIARKEELDKEVGERKAAYGRAEEEFHSEFTDALELLTRQLEEYQRQMEKLSVAQDQVRSQLRSRQTDLEEQTGILDEQRRQKDAAALDAAAVTGTRIHTDTPAAEVTRKLAGMRRSLQTSEAAESRCWEQVFQQFQQAQLAHQRAEQEVSQRHIEIEKLNHMLQNRARNYLKLRDSLQHRVTQYFCTVLNARGFRGVMTFRHQDQRLTVEVRPGRPGGAGRPLQGTQQLSGGERSFSTLAFVLAMWSAMPSPFRMLDEFDVFMDEINRKISHDMLLQNALDHNSQFVFISPLAIPNNRNDDRVTIHRMQPPQR